MKNIYSLVPFSNKLIILTISIFISNLVNGQEFTEVSELPKVYINEDITIHFRSPEKISYVDISSDKIIGDIPLDNVAKFKINTLNDSIKLNDKELAIITIAGDSYLAQYRIFYNDCVNITDVEIDQTRMKNINSPKVILTDYELKKLCTEVIKRKRKFKKVQSKNFGLNMFLNNIYTFGDYIFVDITIENNTNIQYDIEDIPFYIEDKKIYKETNNQSIRVFPKYQLYNKSTFINSYRNVYVFDKFTFPNDKVFNIKIVEAPISGRTLNLKIDYIQLLNADTI